MRAWLRKWLGVEEAPYATIRDLQSSLDGLRRDYDALVNTLKERDARISILENGRETSNEFVMKQIAPALGGMNEFLGECVKRIPSMRKINAELVAKGKREAKRRAKAATP